MASLPTFVILLITMLPSPAGAQKGSGGAICHVCSVKLALRCVSPVQGPGASLPLGGKNTGAVEKKHFSSNPKNHIVKFKTLSETSIPSQQMKCSSFERQINLRTDYKERCPWV